MEKSRIIPLKDYLKNLQLEYLSYSLRATSYERPEFVKMCKDICKKKKEKILSVSKRFGQETIFDSEEKFELFLEKEFNNPYGLPNIQYAPQNSRCVVFWDKACILKKGTVVRVKDRQFVVVENFPNINEVKLKDFETNEVLSEYTSYWTLQITITKKMLSFEEENIN